MLLARLIKKSGTARMLVAASLALASGSCGTQTGNPPVQNHSGKLFEQPVAAAMVSSLFNAQIDHVNLGEYAYSNAESRVVNESECRGSEVVRKTRSEHSTRVQFADRRADVSMTIERDYVDTWYKDDLPLACNSAVGQVNLDFEAGARYGLSNFVSESNIRTIEGKDFTKQEDYRAKLGLKQSGSRSLEFALSSSTEVEASVDLSKLVEVLEVIEDATSQEFVLTPKASSSYSFKIVRDENTHLVESYEIASASLSYSVNDSASIRFSLENIVIASAACLPSSGSIQALISEGEQELELNWVFEDGKLISGDSRLLSEACVLDEL